MQTLVSDIKETLRSWYRKPAFAGGVVLTLALGIGMNAAVFAAIDAVLLEPLPYPDADRLVAIWTELPKQDRFKGNASPPELLDIERRSTVFESVGGIWARSGVLRGDGEEAEQIENGWVSGGFMNTLGAEAFLGRLLGPGDTLASNPATIVLSHELWNRRYGKDPGLIGEMIEFDDEPWTVVGIMPRGFRMWLPTEQGVPTLLDAWTPWRGDYSQFSRSFRVLSMIGRLNATASVDRATSELGRAAADIAAENPGYERTGLGLRATPLQGSLVASARPLLMVLGGVALFVLLVACANVANLSLARANDRQRELAVRSALGASRLRLARRSLVESCLMALLGGGLGVVFGAWVSELLLLLEPSLLPRADEIQVGGRVALFTLAASLVVGVGFGLASVVFAGPPRVTALRGGARLSGTSAAARARGFLVASQMGLSLVLLVGAGLMIRTFVELSRVDPGFDPARVLTLRLSLPDVHYRYADQWEKIARFYARLEERVQALPGVEAAGATINSPLSGFSSRPRPYSFVGANGEVDWETLTADYRTVTPGWFRAVGARLRAGRFLSPSDPVEKPNVVVVDARMAEKTWPGADPIGQRLKVEVFIESQRQAVWANVVGVIDHIQNDRLGFEGREQVYLPHQQSPMRSMTITVRSGLPASALVPAVQGQVNDLEPDLPVFGVATAASHVSAAMGQARFALAGIGLFGGIALILAASGIYAVLAYWVSQRRREMGIRLALGAEPRKLLMMVTGQGLRMVAAGGAAGLLMSLLVSRVLGGLLYGVETNDPATLVVVTAGLCVTALLASWLPARRAASVDPAEVLAAD